MAYTPITKVQAGLQYFQWARPEAPNPRLASPISAADTTLFFTNPPLDRDGNVISGFFVMGIRRNDGYVESVFVPAGVMSADGLVATGVIRGIRLEGLDFATGDPTLASDFDQDSQVFCNISGILQNMNATALTGDIGMWVRNYAPPLWMSIADGISGVAATVPVYATTVVRDANIGAPQNGYSCYVTADGVFYDYVAGAWTTRAAGAVANATTAAAGKVRTETQATFDAGTATVGGDPAVPQANIIQAGLQKGSAQYNATAGGTLAYTLTLTPALAAYTTGQRFYVKWNATNTGTSTLNVNGLGVLTIKKNFNQDVIAGDLLSGSEMELMYDGTNLQIIGNSVPFAFLTTKGDLIAASALDTPIRVGVGSNNQVLIADSTQQAGVKWDNTPITNANIKPQVATRQGDSNGVQTIAHNLGKIPTYLRITWNKTSNGAGSEINNGIGTYDGTNTNTIYNYFNDTAGFFSASTTDTTNIVVGQLGAGSFLAATVTFDATNITLTWTKTGAPSSAPINMLIEVFG